MKRYVLHPITKIVFSILSVFATEILCSALVNELTEPDGKINWREIYNNRIFYLIVFFTVLFIVYTIWGAKDELDYRKKINTKFLETFIEQKGINTLANHVTQAIEIGDVQKVTELMTMMNTISDKLENK